MVTAVLWNRAVFFLLGMLSLQLLTGCAARNRLGLNVRIERAPYSFHGEPLEFWAAIPPASKAAPPVVIFLEGDGGQCQEYSERLWNRFLVRHTGTFVLVRPRTLVNTLCDTDKERWARLDFLHRVDELEVLVAQVRRAFAEGPLVLLGHSAGAHAARLYAERHPEDVAGLINVSGGYDELAGVLNDIAEQQGGSAGKISAFLSEVGTKSPESPVWNRTALFWKQMLFSGVRPLWLSYRKPCLALHGTEDVSSVPWAGVQRDAQALAATGGSCELQGLEGVGHDTLAPSTFHRVDAWLEAHWGDR